MIRTIVCGVAAAGAFTVAGLTSVAHAQLEPTYTCNRVFQQVLKQGRGTENCVPSNGAGPTGIFFGPSVLTSRNPSDPRLLCTAGGIAYTPFSVRANSCTAM